MNGVTFGEYHSYDDFSLILTSKEIAAPKIKTVEIDIPGADGTLDLTEFFGEPKYENVKLIFQFSTIVPQNNFLTQFSTVKNAIHGKKLRISLDAESGFFYVGRCYVSSFTNEKNIGKISVECECEPYKYRLVKTGHIVSLSGKNFINLDDASFKGTWVKTATGFSYSRGNETGGSYVAFKIPLAAGKTYTFSAVISSTGTAASLYVYSGKIYGETVAKNTGAVTFTPEKTAFYFLALIANSTTTAAEFANVMLEESAAATSYAAFESTENTVTTFVVNSKKKSVPDISAQYEVTITNGEETFVIKDGETKTFPEFELKEGSNQFNITGTGVVVFEWQEGEL